MDEEEEDRPKTRGRPKKSSNLPDQGPGRGLTKAVSTRISIEKCIEDLKQFKDSLTTVDIQELISIISEHEVPAKILR